MFRINQSLWLPCAALALAASSAGAAPDIATGGSSGEVTAAKSTTTLKQAFDAAWLRQPEAQSQQARLDAATAQRQAASRWTPEPVALELSNTSDRLNRNLGRNETTLGVSIPLWLPGERARGLSLAEAQARAVSSQVRAAQLRTAAQVREAYWAWQRAYTDHALAAELLGHARQLARDVERRVRAGDLARADQYQAEGAAATAQVALAEASGVLADTAQRLRALTGLQPQLLGPSERDTAAGAEPVPAGQADASALRANHPTLVELQDQAEVAQRAAELAQTQTRANPELTLAGGRDRGQLGDAYQTSLTLGIRIPLSSDSVNQVKRARAQADAIDASVQLRLESEKLLAEEEAAQVGVVSAQARLDASRLRAQLAHETRAFIQKSYQLGETDLPTRLRIEREAMDAERQAGRARIDLAAAHSRLRQFLGLLPE